MKKTLTITGLVIVSLFVLLIASAVIVSNVVDPNKFKGRISQLVYAKTGQVLIINGNMHWSLFPWMGLKAENLAYYNAPTFTPKTFVSAREMDIKVKLLPLITGKMEIGNVTLEDVILNLIKNKSGQYNWQTFKHNDKNNTPVENDHTSNAIAKLSIASLKLKNVKLNWYNQQQNSHTTLTHLNVTSKDIQFGKPFPLALQFDLLNEKNSPLASFDLRSNISLTSDYKNYHFQDLILKGKYIINQNALNFKTEGDIATDLSQQSLLANLNLTFDDMKGQLSLKGNHITQHPRFEGTLAMDSFNLKNLLSDLGKPFTAKNVNALKSVSVLTKIEATDSLLEFTQLHAKIDNTDVFGNINITPKAKNIRFNINANEINVTDYLPQSHEASTSSVSETTTHSDKTSDSKTAWTLYGNIKIAHVNADKLKLSNLDAILDWKNNIIRVSPLHFNIYQGSFNGNILVNKQNQNKTVIQIKQNLTDVDTKELLHELAGSEKLAGKATVTSDLVSTMDGKASFLSGLNGKINLALKEGSLQGVDVIYQLSRAHAFIKHLTKPTMTDSKQTQFSSLTASVNVAEGVLNTDDLALASEYLKVTGKGTTNLVTKGIRYHLNALAQPKLAEENKDIGKEVTIYQIPIKVSGLLSKPSVNLDFTEIAKILLTKEIQKPLEKNINNLKDTLKGKVQEKIKDLSPGDLLSKLTGKFNDASVH